MKTNNIYIIIFSFIIGCLTEKLLAENTSNNIFFKDLSTWLLAGDFLKITISMFIGSFTAGIFSIISNNRNNKFILEKTKLELKHKNKEAVRAELKEYCMEYLSKMELKIISSGFMGDYRIDELIIAIGVFSNLEYAIQASNLKKFAHENNVPQLRDEMFRSHTGLPKELEEYKKLYTELMRSTHNLLLE